MPHRPTTLRGALFDMDGLLIDSEPVWTIAEIELAERYGGVWDDDIKAQCIGTAMPVSVPRMLRYFGLADPAPEQVADAYNFLTDRMVTLFADAAVPRPGALELVDALRDLGIPTALVSSSYRVLVDAALKSIGVERFDCTIAGDEVAHRKPHPEPYLSAAAALGVLPGDCVVFEDAPSGIASAEAAGCLAIGIPGHAPLTATADRPLFDSLADIDLDWLLTLPAALRRAG